MADLPAHHYLRIYRVKLAMASDGTTRPTPSAVEFMKRLITKLEGIDPGAPIRLEITAGVARFTDVKSGAVLAELPLNIPNTLS